MEFHFPSGLFLCTFCAIFLDLMGREMTSVLARISSRDSWLVRSSQNTIFWIFSLSNRCHWTLTWRYFVLQNVQVQLFDLADSFGSSGRFPMTWVPGKYSIRTQSVLHRFQIIRCQNCTWWNSLSWAVHLGLLLNDLASSPSKRRNLSRRTSAFCPRDHLIVRECRSRPWGSCPTNGCHNQNFSLMVQCQFLCDIELILKFFEVCVPFMYTSRLSM